MKAEQQYEQRTGLRSELCQWSSVSKTNARATLQE